VASSGVTQWVSGKFDGHKSIPFPRQGVTMMAGLRTRYPGRLPPDRYVAPWCVAGTGIVIVLLLGREAKRRWLQRHVRVAEDGGWGSR
jgi:hypothetical protein